MINDGIILIQNFVIIDRYKQKHLLKHYVILIIFSNTIYLKQNLIEHMGKY